MKNSYNAILNSSSHRPARKLLTVLLALSFFTTPLFQVFAQTTDATPPPASNTSTPSDNSTPQASAQPAVSPASDDSSSGVPSDATPAPTDSSDSDDTQDQTVPSDSSSDQKTSATPSLSRPIMTEDSLSSGSDPLSSRNVSQDILNPAPPTYNNLTGSLDYEYPIVIPPGRNKVTTPDLSLVYSNQNGEDISPFGYGWSDNIPSIERINKTGPANLYSEYNFTSSLSGDLASTTASTTYVSKSDDGDFLSYTFTNNTWVVFDKYGTKYTFGSSTSARLDNPSDGTQIYKWMLEEVRDTNDNYIKYTYYKDDGQIYPSSIVYSGNGTTDGVNEVDFLRQSRSDVATSTQADFPIVSNYRINEIDTKISGSWVHEYVFGYTTGDNGVRSLLQSVTETSKDESSNTITLPATTFNYSTSTKSFVTDSRFNSPLPLVGYSGYNYDNGVRVVDINGDGLPDIIQSVTSGGATTSQAYINTGSGYVDDPTWYLPVTLSDVTGSGIVYDNAVQLVDINGDGFTDVVQSLYNGTTTDITWINNGAGFTASSTWAMPATFLNSGGFGVKYDRGVRLADFNGDGLVDVIQAVSDNGSTTEHAFINNGHGFTEDPAWESPVIITAINSSGIVYDQGVRIADINGDGLPDIIQSFYNNDGSVSTKHTYINNGHGFTEDPAWNMPIYFIDYSSSSATDDGVRLMDINGDGLVDVVRAFSSDGTSYDAVYINNGHGFTLDSGWTLPIEFIDVTPGTTYDESVATQDIDGNGTLDMLHNYAGDVDSYVNPSIKADSLIGVNLSKGGKLAIGYKGSAQYVDSGTHLSPSLPLNLQTVNTIATNDGMGNYATTSYSYAGGSYYYNNAFDRKFAGFNSISQTDPIGDVTKTYYHQGNSSDSSHGEYNDTISKLGKSYRVEKYDNSGNLYEKTINKWDTYTIATSSDFVKEVQSVDMDYSGQGTHKDKASQFSYDNTNGNELQKVDLGEVTGSDNGTFTDTGTDDFTTNYLYASSTGSKVVGLPYQETLTNHSGMTVAQTKHYYDSQSLGSLTKGNETKTEKLKTGSTYVNTQKTYNSYGLVTQDQDERGKQTNYTYDTNNLFVATSTNALSQATAYQYNLQYGKVKQITDPNRSIFQTVFDAFGRPLQIKQPDTVSTTTSVIKTQYTYTDTGVPTVVQARNYLDATTSVDTFTYLNGFGNKAQEKTQTENSGVYTTKDYKYNGRGDISAQSLPYFTSTASSTTATPIKNLFTYFTYDPLDRVSAQNTAVGTTTYAYAPWKETITDPAGRTKDLYNDAFGNLVQVDEHNSGSTYSTYYQYDGLNDLTKITDASGNVRNFGYDDLGRRTSAEDLHGTSDGTYGTWSYTYDDAGNLTQTVDPKSQTVNYTFDDINRPLTEDYTGASGVEVTNTYDSCAGGIGKLCVAASASATSTYQYDPEGNINQETKRINGTDYTTQTVHDRQGNVTSITNPDSSQIKYTYNSGGLVDSVSEKESGGSMFNNIVNNFDYGPTNQVVYQENANNTKTYFTYDPNELYRLVSKTTLGPGANEGQDMEMMSMESGSDLDQQLDNNTLTVDKKGNKTFARPIEIMGKETPNSKTYLDGYEKNNDPIFTTRINIGNEPSDITQDQTIPGGFAIKDEGDDTLSTASSYSASISKYLSPNLLTFQNGDQTLSFSLASSTRLIQGVQKTDDTQSNQITYPNALGEGIDLSVEADKNKVTKNIVIENKEALSAVTSTSTYDVPFKLTANRSIDIFVDGKQLSKEGTIVSDKIAKIVDSSGVTSYIWPPQAYDSSEIVNPAHRTPVMIKYELRTDGIYLTKEIPVPWLKQAAYPVSADFTVSSYAGNGDGSVETYPYRSLWPTQHPDTHGSNVDYTSSSTVIDVAGYDTDNGYLGIFRGFFPVDTTAIPSDVTIMSANLKLYVLNAYDDYNDGYDYLAVLKGYQATTTALANTDIASCGDAVTNPTEGSSEVDLTGISAGGYASFPLNSTGLGWINKGGITSLCMREGHDLTDNQIHEYSYSWHTNGIVVATSEADGTSTDPYLEITYHLPNSAPINPTGLETNDQTNPINLSNLTPTFSSVYTDPDDDDVATSYQIQVSTSSSSWATSSLLWDSGKTTLSSSTPVNIRMADVTYGGSALSFDGGTYFWRTRFWDSANATGTWSTSTASFKVQTPPPSTNYSECFSAQAGTSSPTDITCGSPFFSTINSSGEGTNQKYEIQVSTTTSFSSVLWDSGSSGKSIGDIASEMRSPNIAYRGDPLTFASSTYYWRIKLWNNGYETVWSDPSVFSTVNAHVLQNIGYTYDPSGNITRITNNSDTSDAHYVDYTYDDLNRLLTASSTNAATGTDYHQTFAYDPIGNLTSKSDLGSYTYAGTNNANPHAVTSIASTTFAYDNNGNLTSSTAGLANTWNYRNFLTGSGNGHATTTDAYDANGSRVKHSTATVTTYYPSTSYSVTGATSTKQVYANNQLISTIVGTGATASTTFVNTDNLTGSNVITDASGTIIENTDYYPYGGIRVDDKGSFNETKKFIGQEYDQDTNLSYLNARYYDGTRGQFLSEDPVFVSLGTPAVKKLTGFDLSNILSNPQSLNSYSYAADNPVTSSDPKGLYDAKNGIVQKGDTLSMITTVINGINNTAYSVSQIAKINGITDPNKISVGQQIIPNMTFYPDITNSLKSTVQTNAADPKIQNGIQGMNQFRVNVQTGGPQDYKDQSGQFSSQSHTGFVFNGQPKPNDFPGNFNYGYVGNSTNWASPGLLLHMAGATQIISNAERGSFSSLLNPPYFDNPGDSSEIIEGIQYNNRH